MSFTASEEIIVGVDKSGGVGSCSGVVIQSKDDGIQIALKGKGLVLRHGSLVHLKSCEKPDTTAWASVHHVSLAGDVKLVQVNSVRYESKRRPRAARCSMDITVSADFTDREQNSRKTNGKTVNISISGVLARFKSTLAVGTVVHLVLHTAPHKDVEAMARVVRIVEGTETASGGYEVGLEFQRFIRGYENLITIAPASDEPSDS